MLCVYTGSIELRNIYIHTYINRDLNKNSLLIIKMITIILILIIYAVIIKYSLCSFNLTN